MLLGALAHEAPETALFLGLGAGSLTQACLKYLPLEDVEAIELRPAVVELARSHLGLADDPRLYIRVGDALQLLDSAETADLIFLDLYTDTGPAAAHLAWDFLRRCQGKLNPGGWLVINQWGTSENKPLGAALLRGLFHRHYWECPVAEGNVVLLVPAELEQSLDRTRCRRASRPWRRGSAIRCSRCLRCCGRPAELHQPGARFAERVRQLHIFSAASAPGQRTRCGIVATSR